MKVTVQKAVDSAVGFLYGESSKVASLPVRFAMLVALGSARANSGPLMAKHGDTLRTLGIVDADGMVDTDVLRSALSEAFARMPELPVMGFTFTSADTDTVLSMMEA